MKKKLVIRADANSTIGSGHIMRCLSIADAFVQKGWQCTFVTAGHSADALLLNKQIDHICLNSQWDNLDGELKELQETIEMAGAELMIIDHYYVTASYLTALKEKVRLVYIDDLKAFRYPCDVLINYNIYALDWRMAYEAMFKDTETKLLLGPQYVPLRREFQSIPSRTISSEVKNVFVSTGGADPENIALRLIDLVSSNPSWEEITFHFVVGALNPNYNQIVQKAKKQNNIVIHTNVKKISELMMHCDAAISAAGSTLYELCACGVPTITYVTADNQVHGAMGFEQSGLMFYAGDCRSNDLLEKNITNAIEDFILSVAQRNEISNFMQSFIDGFGVYRIAEAVC